MACPGCVSKRGGEPGYSEKRGVSKWLRPDGDEIQVIGRNIVVQGSPPEAEIDYQEKRRSPRYSFIASAELIEERADVRIASRVSELSLHGCYLDMMNPFPTGTMVLVKIAAGGPDNPGCARRDETESQKRFGKGFPSLDARRQNMLLTDASALSTKEDSAGGAGK